ncbi:MAG: esterase/lipase family protein [Fidelibacterota bacterium]
MKRGSILATVVATLLVFVPPSLPAQNSYPIVLVHGFRGWGPDEMAGYNYWGGFYDLEEDLKSLGYDVYTVSVGPVSSNWDRAVEMYYQLKGGQVDYGRRHAVTYGIIQKPEGKVYEGLYPQWDSDHPVHLIGHSMGGQTARMLAWLLENRFFSDSLETSPEESPLLGQSHTGWIRSITTISTPHNGTTLLDLELESIPYYRFLITVASVVETDFYNFDLDQWGFKRHEGERWSDYTRRLREHPLWKSKNIGTWDVSLDGARELNTYLRAYPDIYYFSFVTSATHRDTATGFQVPDKTMNFLLRSKARMMGKHTGYWADGTSTDSTWFENDGAVNTVSQYGPTTGLNGPDTVIPFRPGEPLQPGRWYTRGPLRMDHWYVVGHFIMDDEEWASVRKLYEDHCRLLWSLPE